MEAKRGFPPLFSGKATFNRKHGEGCAVPMALLLSTACRSMNRYFGMCGAQASFLSSRVVPGLG